MKGFRLIIALGLCAYLLFLLVPQESAQASVLKAPKPHPISPPPIIHPSQQCSAGRTIQQMKLNFS